MAALCSGVSPRLPRTAAGVGPEDRLPPILRTGHLSPIHPITLTEGDLAASSVAQKIKVPEGAKSFAFSYPFDIDATWFARITGLLSAGSGVDYIQPEWLNFLLVGGYCYFGEDGGLLGSNALSPRGGGVEQTGVELVLVGPYDCAASAGESMRLAGRLQKVTIGSLKAAGFEEFGWVFKSETPGGHALGPEHTQGAFVYRHASESLYFFYQLWLPKVHGSAKTDRKLALDRAMRSNFSRKEGGGSAEGAPVGSPLPERSNGSSSLAPAPAFAKQLTSAEKSLLDEIAAKHKADLQASGMSDELIHAILSELMEEKKDKKRGFGRSKSRKSARAGAEANPTDVELDVKVASGCSCVLQ